MSEHRFEKNLEDILIWSFGPDYKNIRVTDEDVIAFSFDEGYCILRRNNSEFRGSFHPNVVCEGGGICIHCGRTLFN